MLMHQLHCKLTPAARPARVRTRLGRYDHPAPYTYTLHLLNCDSLDLQKSVLTAAGSLIKRIDPSITH